jgi:hypothetical protein
LLTWEESNKSAVAGKRLSTSFGNSVATAPGEITVVRIASTDLFT